MRIQGQKNTRALDKSCPTDNCLKRRENYQQMQQQQHMLTNEYWLDDRVILEISNSLLFFDRVILLHHLYFSNGTSK
jgi:hypothetical protein